MLPFNNIMIRYPIHKTCIDNSKKRYVTHNTKLVTGNLVLNASY